MKNIGQAVNFLLTIEGKTLIVCHWDTDGIASAAILGRIIRQNEVKVIGYTPVNKRYWLGEEVEKIISENKIKNLIITDLYLPAENLEAIVKKYKLNCLYIDHHSFKKIPEGVIFINPRVDDSLNYIPAAGICQKIAEEIGMDYDWIAGFGIVQDRGVELFEKLFIKLSKNYPEYLPRKISQESIINSRFGTYSSVLNIAPYRDLGKFFEIAFQILMKANNLKYIEVLPEYRQIYEEYLASKNEFGRLVKDYREKRETIGNVSFFTVDSDFDIQSSLSTVTSTKEPEMVHIFIKKIGDNFKISLRCQSGKINLVEVLEKVFQGKRDVEFGGHPQAVGLLIPENYFDEFKEKIIKILK